MLPGQALERSRGLGGKLVIDDAILALLWEQVNLKLTQWAKTQPGMHGYCVAAYGQALEIVPYTLAENAGPPFSVIHLRRNP